MRRLLAGSLVAFSFFRFIPIAHAAELELSAGDRLLILVPHPDDEVLCCGGIIQNAVERHLPLKIVYLTYGDANIWSFTVYHHFPVFLPKKMRSMGQLRHNEAVAAAKVLGVSEQQLIFLGYPDFGTLDIWNEHWGAAPPFRGKFTRARQVPYANAYRPGAPYKGEEIVKDLESVTRDFRPTKIFVPHPADDRPDHRALYLFTRVALWNLEKEMSPAMYLYLVHFPPAWPPRQGLRKDDLLFPPPQLGDRTQWTTFSLSDAQIDNKYEALEKHRTQCSYSDSYLTSFVRRNELLADATALTTVEPSSEEFKQWKIKVDSGHLVVTGALAQGLSPSTEISLTAYGYRADTLFEKMPKILIRWRGNRYRVYNQRSRLIHAQLEIQNDGRAFVLRIPLNILGLPQRILSSCEVARKHRHLDWFDLRVTEVSSNSVRVQN